jgi:hypothetical protein
LTQLGLDFEPAPAGPPEPEPRSFFVHGGSMSIEQAAAGEDIARRQELRLLAYFELHPEARLTRHQAAEILGCLEVSAGRALSNLAHPKMGKLRKLRSVKVTGPYGSTCHPYELVRS